MARGKYVKVTMRTPVGVMVDEVEARTVGSDVVVTMPGRNEVHMTVEEVNQAGASVRTARFLASEVLSVVEGQKAALKVGRKGSK